MGMLDGCDGGDPKKVIGPSDCEQRNTAEISLQNGSSGATYDAFVDGARVATLAPGKDFTLSVTARQTHALDFKYSDTGAVACSQATPSLPVCTSQSFTCTANPTYRGITVMNATPYIGIGISVGTRRFDIARNQNLLISMSRGSEGLCVWECPQGVPCRWDCNYTANDNHAYVVQQNLAGSSGDMKIVDAGLRQ
jgi:hypothetical protein